jgi:hypothetical protein
MFYLVEGPEVINERLWCNVEYEVTLELQPGVETVRRDSYEVKLIDHPTLTAQEKLDVRAALVKMYNHASNNSDWAGVES